MVHSHGTDASDSTDHRIRSIAAGLQQVDTNVTTYLSL
jgi:hypothetical protein